MVPSAASPADWEAAKRVGKFWTGPDRGQRQAVRPQLSDREDGRYDSSNHSEQCCGAGGYPKQRLGLGLIAVFDLDNGRRVPLLRSPSKKSLAFAVDRDIGRDQLKPGRTG